MNDNTNLLIVCFWIVFSKLFVISMLEVGFWVIIDLKCHCDAS